MTKTLKAIALACTLALSLQPASYAAPKPQYTLTASALRSEFKSNQVAAGDKYKDKVIKVSGTVREIKERWGSGGEIQIALNTGTEYSSVVCNFPAGYRTNITKIRTGSKATIIGTFMGKMSLFGTEAYGLKDCIIP
jgi:hypothetical protein